MRTEARNPMNSLCLRSEKTACSRATRPVFCESMFFSARLRVVSGCAAGARLTRFGALQSRDIQSRDRKGAVGQADSFGAAC
jgi:hypothetical protein